MNQDEFVILCINKYGKEQLPENERWETAHYPDPKCLGGTSTVSLWGRDHTLQGVLQSEQVGYPCLHHASEERDRLNLSTYYPEYIPLYEKWLKKLKSLGGETCMRKHGGKIPTPGGNPSHLNGGNLQKVHERRKTDSNFDEYMRERLRINGSGGGKVSGPKNKGKRWCNNGHLEKKYLESEGIPQGYEPGRLVKNAGKPPKEDG
jgi:hypothetical protein